MCSIASHISVELTHSLVWSVAGAFVSTSSLHSEGIKTSCIFSGNKEKRGPSFAFDLNEWVMLSRSLGETIGVFAQEKV